MISRTCIYKQTEFWNVLGTWILTKLNFKRFLSPEVPSCLSDLSVLKSILSFMLLFFWVQPSDPQLTPLAMLLQLFFFVYSHSNALRYVSLNVCEFRDHYIFLDQISQILLSLLIYYFFGTLSMARPIALGLNLMQTMFPVPRGVCVGM